MHNGLDALLGQGGLATDISQGFQDHRVEMVLSQKERHINGGGSLFILRSA
jgi:hypothetical protein